MVTDKKYALGAKPPALAPPEESTPTGLPSPLWSPAEPRLSKELTKQSCLEKACLKILRLGLGTGFCGWLTQCHLQWDQQPCSKNLVLGIYLISNDLRFLLLKCRLGILLLLFCFSSSVSLPGQSVSDSVLTSFRQRRKTEGGESEYSLVSFCAQPPSL